ncbi:MAG: hypothetical protein IKF78_09590 [Atopobiaceae bacterium]|nr:hypothetical protein [Atopobiaceae bacterium]
MKKRAFTAVMGTLLVTIALAGCGGAPAASSQVDSGSSISQSSSSTEAPPEQLAGGWRTYDGATPAYTDEEKAVFDKATEGATGVGYELVRTLGTQVVSGTNYAFLARGTTVTAEPVTAWYVIVAYRDLSGNVSLSSAQPIDLANPKTTDKTASTNVVGAWELCPPSNAVLEPKEVGDAFSKASQGYAGVALSPIATLGSQVVSGANYLVLCEGTPAAQDAKEQLYLVTLYVDPQGTATISDVRGFDLLGYLAG